MATLSQLFATPIPTNAALPISSGTGAAGASLDDWVTNGSGGGVVAAEDVTYSNGSSGLSANNVQDAIDELALSSGSGAVSHTGALTLDQVVVGSGLGDIKILPAGTNGFVLTMAAGIPAWASGGGGGGSPGGSNTQLQFNNVGSFGGISGATTNGTVVTFSSTNLIAEDILVGATNQSFIGSTGGNLLLQSFASGSTNIELRPAGSGQVYYGTPTSTLPSGNVGVFGLGFFNRNCVAAAYGPISYFSKGRGSFASPGQTLSGDTIADFMFGGYTGSGWNEYAANFSVVALENYTAGAVGTKFVFNCAPIGATPWTTPSSLSIASTGITCLGITTGNPSGGTAAAWKLGSLVTAAVTFDPTQYVELDVGGTLVKLLKAT